MLFSVGIVEVAVILVTGLVSVAIVAIGNNRFSFGNVRLQWSLAVLGCMTLAAVLTPADVVSTLLLATLFFGIYLVGTWHGSLRKRTSA